MRVLHNGSALAFQARGGGSIPPTRSKQKPFQRMSWRCEQVAFEHDGVVLVTDCPEKILTRPYWRCEAVALELYGYPSKLVCEVLTTNREEEIR